MDSLEDRKREEIDKYNERAKDCLDKIEDCKERLSNLRDKRNDYIDQRSEKDVTKEKLSEIITKIFFRELSYCLVG